MPCCFLGSFLQQFFLPTVCSKRLWRSETMDQKGECHGMQTSHTDAESLHLMCFCLLHDNKSTFCSFRHVLSKRKLIKAFIHPKVSFLLSFTHAIPNLHDFFVLRKHIRRRTFGIKQHWSALTEKKRDISQYPSDILLSF